MKAEQQIAAMPRSAVSLQYIIHNGRHMVELYGIEAFQAGHHFGGLFRCLRVKVKEIAGGDVEVLTDIEKPSHGGQRLPAFDVADIPGVLSESEAHFTRRYSFLNSELGQPLPQGVVVSVAVHLYHLNDIF